MVCEAGWEVVSTSAFESRGLERRLRSSDEASCMVATLFSHGAPRAMFAIVGLGLIACVQILALSFTGWVTSGVSSSLISSPVKGDHARACGEGCGGHSQT